MSYRTFRLILDGKKGGLVKGSTPASAAKKAYKKLSAETGKSSFKFELQETTKDSKKKVYGPYKGCLLKDKIKVKMVGGEPGNYNDFSIRQLKEYLEYLIDLGSDADNHQKSEIANISEELHLRLLSKTNKEGKYVHNSSLQYDKRPHPHIKNTLFVNPYADQQRYTRSTFHNFRNPNKKKNKKLALEKKNARAQKYNAYKGNINTIPQFQNTIPQFQKTIPQFQKTIPSPKLNDKAAHRALYKSKEHKSTEDMANASWEQHIIYTQNENKRQHIENEKERQRIENEKGRQRIENEERRQRIFTDETSRFKYAQAQVLNKKAIALAEKAKANAFFIENPHRKDSYKRKLGRITNIHLLNGVNHPFNISDRQTEAQVLNKKAIALAEKAKANAFFIENPNRVRSYKRKLGRITNINLLNDARSIEAQNTESN
jgi:ribosomal protein L29